LPPRPGRGTGRTARRGDQPQRPLTRGSRGEYSGLRGPARRGILHGRKDARPPEAALTRRPDLPRAEKMVVIAVPITEVFAYIADGTNNPQWRPWVMDITSPEDGPDEAAVNGQGLRGPKGQRMDGDYRITDYQPPNRLAFEVIAGPARPTGAFDLEEPVAGATKVRFSLDLEARGLMKVPMRFASKIIE